MATCPPKHIIHDWIREDLPLSVKMTITPVHVDQLLRRIETYNHLDKFVSKFVEFKDHPNEQ